MPSPWWSREFSWISSKLGTKLAAGWWNEDGSILPLLVREYNGYTFWILGYCLNISCILGGGLECDSNKIVRSLCGLVVVEVVADVVVVVNVVVGGMAELTDSLVGDDGGWLGREMLVYKTGGTVVVMIVVVIVDVVLELSLLGIAAGAAAVVLFNLGLWIAGEVGCSIFKKDVWAEVVVVMSVLGGVNFPVFVLFLWEFLYFFREGIT